MHIFVMVDMEGISGIFESAQVQPGAEHYERGRHYLTWDINACVEGCFAGGATKVTVRDAHGGGNHIVWEELDSRAHAVRGDSPIRMPGMESCKGLILLGYHAMAGTPAAVLEHTMNSTSWQNLWMNGKKSGEIAIDAGIAADHSVPTIMVSGDDRTCREAKRFIKGVVTAEVKKGLAVEGATLLPMDVAHERIRSRAELAVQNCVKIKPYRVRRPVRIRLEMVSRKTIPLTRHGVKVIDGRTYEVTGDSVEDAMNQL
jgi:D-amino peptidase